MPALNIRGDAPYRRPLLAQRCNHLAAVRWRVEIFLLQALVSPKPASSPGIVPQTTIVRCLHHLRPHHCGHSASRIVNLLRSSHSLLTDLCNHRMVFVDRRGEANHSDAINFIRSAIPSLNSDIAQRMTVLGIVVHSQKIGRRCRKSTLKNFQESCS